MYRSMRDFTDPQAGKRLYCQAFIELYKLIDIFT